MVSRDDKAVIETTGGEFREPVSESGRPGEVERRSRSFEELPRRDVTLVDFEEGGGPELEAVCRDGALSGEIEVGMVGEIEMSGPVCGGMIVDREGIVAAEPVGRGDDYGSGVALVSVRAGEGECYGGSAIPLYRRLTVPELPVEAGFPAVNVDSRLRMDAGEVVPDSVDGEPATIDAVRKAPDYGTEDTAPERFFEGVVGKCDASGFSFAVRSVDGNEKSSVFGKTDGGAVIVCQGENPDFPPVRHFPPDGGGELGSGEIRDEEEGGCQYHDLTDIFHMCMLSPSIPRVNTTLMAFLVTTTLHHTFAEDWPVFRGVDRNGIAAEGSLALAGEVGTAWTAEVGLGYSAPVVSGGKLVITGHDGTGTDTVFCFNEATGEELWKFSYPQPLGDLYFQGGTTGTVTFDGDRLYHVAREGEVFCLNAKDGAVIWKRHLQDDFGYSKPTWGFTGAPLVMGGRVYLTAGESGLALDKKDGGEIWKSKNEEAGYSSPFPIRRGETQYLIFTQKRSYVCVKAETGEVVWEHRWMTRYGVNAADPVVSGDYIFISSGYGKGAVLLSWNGSGKPEKVWQNRELRTQMNAAVLIDGYLYGVDGNESVDGTGMKCLDFMTGETKWTDTSIGHGTLCAVGGQLVVLSESGDLQIGVADPAGFEPVVSGKAVPGRVWTVPVVAQGKIFARNESGRLAAITVGKGS